MRSILFLAAVLIPAGAVCADTQQFSGTWEARFKGALICTMKLTAGDQVSGAMHGCAVHVDRDGALIETEFESDPAKPDPLLNVKVDGEILHFELADDGDAPMKMELKITGQGQAELRFVDAPVKIKPIRFDRK